MNRPDDQTIVTDEHGNEFACFSKNFGTDIGITVCGNFINDKEFRMEYYYPYLHGSQITTNEMIEIERHAGRESFAGICDELKLGVTLIFYIENIYYSCKIHTYMYNIIKIQCKSKTGRDNCG